MTIDTITREALVEKLKQYPTLLQQFLVLVDTQGTTLDDIQEILKKAEEAENNANIAAKSAVSAENSASKAKESASNAEKLSSEALDKVVAEVNRAVLEEMSLGEKIEGCAKKNDTQSFTGVNTFEKEIKCNQLANTNDNALVRFKETENKNVFGGVNSSCVLMGASERPLYSNDGSDFNGKEIALVDDVKHLYKHDISLGNLSHNIYYDFNASKYLTGIGYICFCAISNEKNPFTNLKDVLDNYVVLYHDYKNQYSSYGRLITPISIYEYDGNYYIRYVGDRENNPSTEYYYIRIIECKVSLNKSVFDTVTQII